MLIATHAHRDHISGFASHEDIFSTFDVSEVWLPWTENPRDSEAVRLQSSQQQVASSLTKHFAASPLPPEQQQAVDAVLTMASGNERALRLLKTGLKGATVRYLEAGVQFDKIAGIPGLSATILGPPRDEKLLGSMDPAPNQHFLGAAASSATDPDELQAFDKSWQVGADATPYYAAIGEREKNLIAVSATNARVFPFALDDHLNNTSIVALFSYGGQHLLFPGTRSSGTGKIGLKSRNRRSCWRK